MIPFSESDVEQAVLRRSKNFDWSAAAGIVKFFTA